MQQEATLAERLTRAKELLQIVRHAALATVNADGSPHNSPVFSTFDADLNFYWSSNQDTQHSKNVARDPRVFVVIFDSTGKGGGLYVKGQAAVCEGPALTAALKVVNANLVKVGRPPVTADYYSGSNPNRLYKATCQEVWVNMTERTPDGLIIRDYRHPIVPADLR